MSTSLRSLLCFGLLCLVPGMTLAADPVPSADGVPIAYDVAGTGDPTLVFVHGWSCDRGYWRNQVAAFAGAGRVITIDLAGHGDSGQERAVMTMEAYGRDVAAVLAAEDVTGAILIGHSMGGAVIAEAALAAPDRVRGLVGVDNFQNIEMELSPEMIGGFVGTFEADFINHTTSWVRQMFPAGADSALVAAVSTDMASAPPVPALSALRELLGWYGSAVSERLALLKVPLMGISSDFQPTNTAAIMAIIPAYELRLMPGRGHFLMLEDPVLFNTLLVETVAALVD